MATEKIILAGFGGQGVMLMGQLLTYAGMLEDKHVSWLPSYGPEMRGGTANCHVIISDTPIGSPIIDHDATTIVMMNLPSLRKFEKEIVEGGNVVINSSLITEKTEREDCKGYYVDANNIAIELNNLKVSNMVMLGAIVGITNCVTEESVLKALKKKLGEKKAHLLDLNKEAFERGSSLV